jgi:hypothetical protein
MKIFDKRHLQKAKPDPSSSKDKNKNEEPATAFVFTKAMMIELIFHHLNNNKDYNRKEKLGYNKIAVHLYWMKKKKKDGQRHHSNGTRK